MPINTTNQGTKATYYNLKLSIKDAKSKNEIDIERQIPCLIIWNGTESVFASNSIGGHLAKITLGEVEQKKKKDGNTFSIQNMYLEFQSQKDNQLVREVVVFNADTNMCRTVVSKLLTAKNYTNINLVFFSAEREGKRNSVAMVYQGKAVAQNKLEHGIIIQKATEKYDKTDDIMYISPKRYVSEDGGFTTDWNKAMKAKDLAITDPKWQVEMMEVYSSAIKVIQERLTDFVIQKDIETKYSSDYEIDEEYVTNNEPF